MHLVFAGNLVKSQCVQISHFTWPRPEKASLTFNPNLIKDWESVLNLPPMDSPEFYRI